MFFCRTITFGCYHFGAYRWWCLYTLGDVVAPAFSVADFDLTFTFGALIVVRVLMVVVYDFLKVTLPYNDQTLNVLVYGNDEKAVSLAMRFKGSSITA